MAPHLLCKYLLCKHEILALDPQNPRKNLGIVVCTVIQAPGSQRQEDPRSFLASHPT